MGRGTSEPLTKFTVYVPGVIGKDVMQVVWAWAWDKSRPATERSSVVFMGRSSK